MSILDRDALEASPLADLHAIASELSIDGYRRLRREPLIDAILDRQAGGGEGGRADAGRADAGRDEGGRGEGGRDEGGRDDAGRGDDGRDEGGRDEGGRDDAREETPSKRRRGRRGGRAARGADSEVQPDAEEAPAPAPE